MVNTASPQPKTPKLWESIGLVLTQMLVLLLLLIVFGVLTAVFNWGQDALIYASFLGEILLVFPMLIWVSVRKFSWRETFALHPTSIKMIVIALALGMLAWPLASAAAIPFEWLLSKIGAAPELPAPQTTMQTVILGITVVLVAPLVEEPMLRGFVLRSWLPLGGGIAAVASGILFGVLHGQLAQLVALIVVGVLLGGVVLRSGSIIPPMILHGTFNAISFAALLSQNRLSWLDDGDLLIIALAVLPLFGWLLLYLWRATAPKPISAPPLRDSDWILAFVGGIFVSGLFVVFAALDVLSRLLPPTLQSF